MSKFKQYIILVLFTVTIAPAACAQNKTVTLDYFFNNEYRKNASGAIERFHYTWEDTRSSGYSIWGDIFKKRGATLKSLAVEPSAESLKGSDIYIIVDPDTKKETAHPNYIEHRHIEAITAWVKNGGVLVMLANDSANAELPHFNRLAEKFGIHFNEDLYKHVIDKQFEMGAINILSDNPVFKTAKKVYLKDIATLKLSGNATPVLTDSNKVIVAIARYGKGIVFAVGDPWIYNEYTNGRLPASDGFENDKAAEDITKWLLAQGANPN
jgi:unsaturated rhamnogalacturonyl hydrolase